MYACMHKKEPQKPPEHTLEHIKSQNFPHTIYIYYGPRFLCLPWAPPILSVALVETSFCFLFESLAFLWTTPLATHSQAQQPPWLQVHCVKQHNCTEIYHIVQWCKCRLHIKWLTGYHFRVNLYIMFRYVVDAVLSSINLGVKVKGHLATWLYNYTCI